MIMGMHSLSFLRFHEAAFKKAVAAVALIGLTAIVMGNSLMAQAPDFKSGLGDGWKVTDYAGSGPIEIADGQMEIRMGEQLTGVAWNKALPARMNYQVDLEAMKVDGSDFFCMLTIPYGESACSLVLGGWGGGVVGISSINGQDASANETTDYRRFEKGQWYKIQVKVTPDSIQAFLDNERIVNLMTQNRKLDIRFGVEEFLPFGIGTWQTTARYRNLKWTSLAKPGTDDLKDGHHYIPTKVSAPEEDLKLVAMFEGLRVADVSDALDRYGFAGRTLMDTAIHPLWKDTEDFSHRITGVAVTARYIPAQEPTPHADTNDAFNQWVSETYRDQTPEPFTVLFHKGSILVIEEAGETDTGSIGSNNIMQWKILGCRGVITSNSARDLDEIAAQKIPLYLKKPGRGIRPGRNQLESVNTPIVCGGVQVRPGDIIVADGDGVVVVPRNYAEKVASFAHTVLRGDKESRRDSYRKLGIKPDASVR